ncbi:SGNH/GDSL hydrolase family protein [Spongiactinospora rosea]|uniref:SGNH/GDSL hydrolase family protein n=2 Tax=Spongiactinospora rosea TaxID=2248750 RepID=A0A366M427_9ACTN|nr:SGNH/GDSL hydrolase family protein [Spongiactinospora rosea]
MSAALAVAVALAGCGAAAVTATPARTATPAPTATGVKVLWMGDSIAGAQAPAVAAALTAAGVAVKDATSAGGGNVVAGGHEVTTMGAADTWKRLQKEIASFRPTVIAYQITAYDWGTTRQQLAAYRKLARTAGDAKARLVLISPPPFKIDDFFRPHEKAIRSAPAMAAKAGNATFLDTADLWGDDPAADRAQRAKDGIHSCQQGSAAFAAWFAKRLGELTGFTPAAPAAWATGRWTGDERFGKLGCG